MNVNVHRSPVLSAIYKEIIRSRQNRVLDLGPMRGPTFDFFNRPNCKMHFENLDAFIEEFGKLSTDNLIFRLQRYLLTHKSEEKFNIVLAWDLLNYLPLDGVSALMELIARHCMPDAILHVLMYTKKQIPPKPRNCCIKDKNHVELDEEMACSNRKLPQVDTTSFVKHCPGYVLQDAVANQAGMEKGVIEYLLRYTSANALNEPGSSSLKRA